jgi:succinylglutamic semialdehyde dehydrogenase
MAGRKALLLKLRERLAAHAEALALAITREVGKPLWESRSEVQAALNKIDITLSDGLALVAPREVAKGQRYAFKPHGIALVLGPFNFPLHLVHGHVVPLLALGNCVLVKPSELTPLVGQLYAQCFHEAGFPEGVFNLVQGPATQGALLVNAPVDLIALTGSYAAGQAIKRATFDQPEKLLALELGGHNPAIVLADADMDKAVHDVLWGALVTAGQRCSGTALALVERACFTTFAAKLRAQMDRVVIGDPLKDGVFMGPLVSEAARARYLESIASAEAAGFRRMSSSRSLSIAPTGAYVEPSLHLIGDVRSAHRYPRDELFGPDLALQQVDDLDQALSVANGSDYGLSASVFTASEGKFEHAFHELRYGCVNWNAPTCGASSRLPFGGTRQSGNHRPAALFSTLYAAYPVASIHGAQSLDPASVSPGFPLPEQSSG